ncbi:MAG: exosortase/archaeosortase family protein [Candidatus Micrarchaeota archaeon]
MPKNKSKNKAENKTGNKAESFWNSRFSAEQREFLKKFPPLFFVPYIAMRFIDWSVLNDAIAAFESSALASLGYANERAGSFIIANGSAFEIIVDCSGIVMIIMFLALYYSTGNFAKKNKPQPPRSPWIYLPLLFAFNLARLLATLIVGISFGGSAMEATHLALWFVDSGVVLACWAHAKNLDFSVR